MLHGLVAFLLGLRGALRARMGSGHVTAMIGGVAIWGFVNVLGRQSVFPAGSLDE